MTTNAVSHEGHVSCILNMTIVGMSVKDYVEYEQLNKQGLKGFSYLANVYTVRDCL